MWGNLRGWAVSAVIMIVTVVLLVLLSRLNELTDPTWTQAQQKRFLAPISFPIDPHALLTGTTNGDAGDAYRLAIKDYNENDLLYHNYVVQREKDPEAFQQIFAGGKCNRMSLLMDYPDQYVGYDEAFFEPLVALDKVKNAMLKRGFYLLKTNKQDEAKKYYEAVYSLGVKLYDERLVMQELDVGLTALAASLGGPTTHDGLYTIAVATGDKQRADQLLTLKNALTDYYKNTYGVMYPMMRDQKPDEPGNLFLLAQNGQERVWRVEAIRQLGRMKFNPGEHVTAQDQRGVSHLLRRWLAHPPDANFDEVMRDVSQKALDVTPEGIQNQSNIDAVELNK